MLLGRIDNSHGANSEEQKNTPCLKRLWCSYMRNVHWRRLPHRQRVGALPQRNLPTEIKYRQSQYHSPLHRDDPPPSLRQGISHWSELKQNMQSWSYGVIKCSSCHRTCQEVRDGCGVGCDVRGNGKRAQCFHYAVISAVRREAPLRSGLSSPWIPEGRVPHLAFIQHFFFFFYLNNVILLSPLLIGCFNRATIAPWNQIQI